MREVLTKVWLWPLADMPIAQPNVRLCPLGNMPIGLIDVCFERDDRTDRPKHKETRGMQLVRICRLISAIQPAPLKRAIHQPQLRAQDRGQIDEGYVS